VCASGSFHDILQSTWRINSILPSCLGCTEIAPATDENLSTINPGYLILSIPRGSVILSLRVLRSTLCLFLICKKDNERSFDFFTSNFFYLLQKLDQSQFESQKLKIVLWRVSPWPSFSLPTKSIPRDQEHGQWKKQKFPIAPSRRVVHREETFKGLSL